MPNTLCSKILGLVGSTLRTFRRVGVSFLLLRDSFFYDINARLASYHIARLSDRSKTQMPLICLECCTTATMSIRSSSREVAVYIPSFLVTHDPPRERDSRVAQSGKAPRGHSASTRYSVRVFAWSRHAVLRGMDKNGRDRGYWRGSQSSHC